MIWVRSVHFREPPRNLPVPLAMSDEAENSIRVAVQDCLARCYKGGTPLGVIAEYLAELRRSGWPEDQVRQVENSVRKVLAGVMLDEE
jgi:hypothetical protein